PVQPAAGAVGAGRGLLARDGARRRHRGGAGAGRWPGGFRDRRRHPRRDRGDRAAGWIDRRPGGGQPGPGARRHPGRGRWARRGPGRRWPRRWWPGSWRRPGSRWRGARRWSRSGRAGGRRRGPRRRGRRPGRWRRCRSRRGRRPDRWRRDGAGGRRRRGGCRRPGRGRPGRWRGRRPAGCGRWGRWGRWWARWRCWWPAGRGGRRRRGRPGWHGRRDGADGRRGARRRPGAQPPGQLAGRGRRPVAGRRRRAPGGDPVTRGPGIRPARALAAAALVLASGLGVAVAPATPAVAQDGQWWHEAWRMPEVWQITDGSGVTVAVVDSGVDASVPDLAGAVVPGADIIGAGTDGRVDTSESGHGTGMASLIASRGTASGVVGVAPGAAILPINLGPPEDRANVDGRQDFSAAIKYAADQGAAVVNVSRGAFVSGPEPCPPPVAEAVRYAIERDVVVVASTRNEPDGPAAYPESCPGVVTVGALTPDLAP